MATIAPPESPASGARVWVVRDALAVARRNLIVYLRIPQLLVFSTIQPVIFVVMFLYVVGGAISVPNGSYVDYLMPGIFVQTVVFGSMTAAVGLAADLKSGLLERFHSLPMARSAVLTGRTSADLVRNVFIATLMARSALPLVSASIRTCWPFLQGWHWCCCSAIRSPGSSPRWDSRSVIPRQHRLHHSP